MRKTGHNAASPSPRAAARAARSAAASISSEKRRAPSLNLACMVVGLALSVAAFFALAAGPASAATPNFCPSGQEAGHCEAPSAVAVDGSSGDVYVGDINNHRVDVFGSEGHFLRAFGPGVVNGESILQTCTTACIQGREGFLPQGVAIDDSGSSSAGDVYVFNGSNSNVEKLKREPLSGEFESLLTFGGPGTGPGEFAGERHPVTIDSAGHVWVGDRERLEEFSEAGALLSEVQLPGCFEVESLAIDEGGDFDLAAVHNEAQEFTPPGSGTYTLEVFGAATGELSASATASEIQSALNSLFGEPIAKVAGPDGGPYVIELLGRSAEVTASAGALSVLAEGGPPRSVEKVDPTGALLESLDQGGHPNSVAVDRTTGDRFISDQVLEDRGTATLLQFDSTGSELKAFGSGEIIGAPHGNAIDFQADHLYVVSASGGEESAAQAFAVPPPGPLALAGTTEAIEIRKTTATLCAEVNPEGKSTTAHFEYLAQLQYEEDGEEFGTGTEETPESGPIGEDFSPHRICQPASALTPATRYRFRVVATNADAPAGNDGEPASFAALPAVAVEATSASEVTASSATLEAAIDSLGDVTFYHFEYLPEAAYLANGESFSGSIEATRIPVPDASLEAGESSVTVSQHLQGLALGTTYRYRIVAHNTVSEANGGPVAAPSHAFTTQATASSSLPDDRGWELVSPSDKHGGSLLGIAGGGLIQASSTGDAITYPSLRPTEADPEGGSSLTEVLSTHGSTDWSTVDLNPPHPQPTSAASGPDYYMFSTDLSRALLQPLGPPVSGFSPAASEETPFVRSTFPAGEPSSFCTSLCNRPVITGCPGAGTPCAPQVEAAADVPAGTVFAKEGRCLGSKRCGPQFGDATPDLAHLLLESELALTVGAAPPASKYEWSEDKLPSESIQLVTRLPNGEADEDGGVAIGNSGAGNNIFGFSNKRGAFSDDGSVVVFSDGSGHLYLRFNATEAQSQVSGAATDGSQCTEPSKACTVLLDELQPGAPGGAESPLAYLDTASTEGSRVFFTDSQQLTAGAGSDQDLYEYNLEASPGERLSDLTPDVAGESADVQGILPGASQDGAYVYFVADGVLAHNTVDNGNGPERARPGHCVRPAGAEPPSGTCNLYLRHASTTSYIATLSGGDLPDWGGQGGTASLTARVSPNGHWLAFMSQRSLTGYDNRDAITGEPDQEVFLYEAATGKLACASCNPTGARPHGYRYQIEGPTPVLTNPLSGGDRVWQPNTWLAANIPGWTAFNQSGVALHQSRYLSDSGRLFFNSSDSLVPADTNGAVDVYQFEPPASAPTPPPDDTCSRSGPTYSPTSAGCVDLITSGTSAQEAAFLDASETGTDVFFLSHAQLSVADTDTALDVYDARVGGGDVQSVRPVECSGDACQQPAVPPNDPTPGSLTFSGVGNVFQCSKGKAKKSGKCIKKQQPKKHKKRHKKAKPKNSGKKKKQANSTGGGQK